MGKAKNAPRKSETLEDDNIKLGKVDYVSHVWHIMINTSNDSLHKSYVLCSLGVLLIPHLELQIKKCFCLRMPIL